jgi:hypothetical protein
MKIRAEANPYDPSWETYFEKRLDVQMVRTLVKADAIASRLRTGRPEKTNFKE